ncbi:DEAD/DEAH box helicase [Clostridium tarantellae]|uniref:ATP-dependent helicase n=1 Tax=Clostridium tarantellae TaxID=39493 RepID=A0A6I1MLV6_9CLOT|nr:DEAD/DEAH box helicase [Clostridium tarantellae]MPQ44415.1 hypothetical protein [Clostridium tarantellae]
MENKIVEMLHKNIFNNVYNMDKQKAENCLLKGYVSNVKSITLDEVLNISSKVKSEKYEKSIYYTNMEIDLHTKDLIFCECECEEYFLNYTWNGETKMCKHLLATFLKYEQSVKINNTKQGINDFLSKEPKVIPIADEVKILLRDIENIALEKWELMSLDVFINEFKQGKWWEVSFKIGGDKKYVLKNLEDFINYRRTGRTIAYGTAFTYDPDVHSFSQDDENIISFIEEYVDLAQMPNSRDIKFLKNKNLILSESAFKRFLKCVGNKIINYKSKNIEKKLKVKNEDMPLELSLKEEDNVLLLKQSKELIPISLTYSNEVFIFNNHIYIPSKNQLKLYMPFYNLLNKKNEIVFKKDYAYDVFNKVLPVINTISKKFNLDEKIEKMVEKSELSSNFYLDKNKDTIWCKIKINYGDISFDYIEGYKGEKYIIRDLEKEKNLEKSLEKLKFFRINDKFIFKGDDNELFTFLKEGIYKLGNLGEIYYSDRFKEQKLYNSKSISASIGSQGGFLDFSFSIGDIEPKEFKNILKAFKEKRKFYKLNNNCFFDFEDKKTKSFLNMLDILNNGKNLKGNKLKLEKNRAIYLSEKIEESCLDFIEGKSIVNDIASKIATISQIHYDIPKDLKANLREYQKIGFKWLKTLSHYGFGGILADEMGLGKTIQTIAFLLSEKDKKSLIVTPTSLIYNWKNEFEKFAPSIKLLILHGSKDSRLNLMNNIKDYDVIITTYGTLRNDFHIYKDLEFNYFIIDEAQNIKNPLAQSTEVVKEVKADVRFALTGTPMENNLLELWSIFDFIMPKYLYGRTRFQKEFMNNNNEGVFQELKKLIKPFILRRIKKDVMEELPDKIEKKFFVEMTEEQKKVYSTFVKNIQKKIKNRDIDKDRITVFSYLTKLRQLCLDPSLLVEGYIGESAKINTALDIIKDGIKLENKILLFSQFTSVLSNFKSELKKNKIEYFYLDGSIKAKERLRLVEEFNNNKNIKVFLISLKAGGTGLNLTSANMVIHFDPWWNPAVEDQATDRAHRFGQKNVVEVIKLISQGTVEEKIINMQENKKELISKVMNENLQQGSFLKTLSKKEIIELFSDR